MADKGLLPYFPLQPFELDGILADKRPVARCSPSATPVSRSYPAIGEIHVSRVEAELLATASRSLTQAA